MSSLIPVEFPQNSMVGQQRQQILELQFDKFFHPQSFLVRKIRFKNQANTCSDCPSGAMLWFKEVHIVYSLEGLKSSRSVCGNNVPNFELLDAKIASALNKITQKPIQEEGQSRGTESREKDRFLRGQIAFMIYDYFRVTGAHDTVLDYAG